jgi:hypothetical protein
LRHAAIDMRKDVRAGIVQRVIEVEYPDTSRVVMMPIAHEPA